MRRFRSAFWSFVALLMVLLPSASAHAGVFISVGFAPPALPVYVQPPCPEPNLMWAPGYWAYGDDGYYWVPGAWVPAPYEGALWTPAYWGWGDGLYVFHPGYWGPVVGYYGGVNYGFGYMGVGFVGGEWREHEFAYNTAVVNVNRTYIHNTYINNTIVENHTIVNNNHIAYAGGPGGIQHQPTMEERNAMQSPHMAATRFQAQQEQQARVERTSYFNANHGRPQNLALTRPLQAERHEAPAGFAVGARGNMNANMGERSTVNANAGAHANMPAAGNRPMQPYNRPVQNPGKAEQNGMARPTYQPPPQRSVENSQVQRVGPQEPVLRQRQPQVQTEPQVRPIPQYRPAPQAQQRNEPQMRPQVPQYRPAQPQMQQRNEPQPQYRPSPQPRPQTEQRPAPESRAPQQKAEDRPRR